MSVMGLLVRSFSNLGERRQPFNAIGRFDAFTGGTVSNRRCKRKRALRLCRFQPLIESLYACARIDFLRPSGCFVKLRSVRDIVALVARAPRLKRVARPIAMNLFDN